MAAFTRHPLIVRMKVTPDFELQVTDVLRALKQQTYSIKGAQISFGGKNIDIVCKDETTATVLAARGLDLHDRHVELELAGRQMVHVSVFVPIAMPDAELNTLMARYGSITKTRRLHFKEEDLKEFENGVRVVEYSKITTPIPGRIVYGGISIGIKYTGQPKTCLRCSSFDHMVKDCPLQRRKNTTPRGDRDVNKDGPSPPAERQEGPKSSLTPTSVARDLAIEMSSPPGLKREHITAPDSPDKTAPKKLAVATTSTETTTEKIDANFEQEFAVFYQDIFAPANKNTYSHINKSCITMARALWLLIENGLHDVDKAATLKLSNKKALLAGWVKMGKEYPSPRQAQQALEETYRNYFFGKI